jgi:hypothetical protein
VGTTRDALNAGSMAFKYVVAIEGYPYLLTDADPAQAVAAWAGTDWLDALGGLYVELENQQQLHPFEPFQSAGTCMLRVVRTTPADTFGVDTHRRAAGFSTELTQTADRDDTTLTVQSTGSRPSFGTLFIGSECLVYTGKTSTTFTGCTRGIYSPFANGAGGRFAGHHRVGSIGDGPRLRPRVTTQRRHWVGAWVGVWMHRVVGDVLDTKAQSELVYAGRIASIADSATPECTVVELKHVLDVALEAVCGREMWTAKIVPGLYIPAGATFRMKDFDGSVRRVANSLETVSGPTSDPNEITAGLYSHAQLYAALNRWLENATDAGNLGSTITIGSAEDGSATVINWEFETGVAADADCSIIFELPIGVALYLGFGNEDGPISNHGRKLFSSGGPTGDLAPNQLVSSQPPNVSLVQGGSIGGVTPRTYLTEAAGTFINQYNWLPGSIKPPDDMGAEWGVFQVGSWLGLGRLVSNSFIDFDYALASITSAYGRNQLVGIPAGAELEIKQVYLMGGTLAQLLSWLLTSTGTAGHNGTNDVLGHGIGIGLPGALMTGLAASLEQLPGGDAEQVVLIDEPTKFSELWHGDLILRGAFPRWKHASLEVATWRVPTAAAALATLGEDSKAAPSGHDEDHRTASVEDTSWTRSIIKLDYNRDPTDLSQNGGYTASIKLIDSGAVDDANGESSAVTIKCRNTYNNDADQGAAIEALAPLLLARLPTLARPTRLLTRSIDQRYWLSLAVGDVVLVADNFTRDPDTGQRGIAPRPAYITKHRWNPGGLVPGSTTPNPMNGELDLMLVDADQQAAYVPAAQVDETQANAGYNSGTLVLTCYAHKYSESSEPADASRFPVGTAIRIVEIDPDNPASPLTWDRIVASQSGNTITHDGSALAGWSSSKRYRVIFDTYGDATAAQRAYAYQADDADGQIADLAQPRQYIYGTGDTGVTAPSLNDPIELVPTLAYGDGVGRDVGHEVALARLGNRLLDRRLAHSSPFLTADVMAAATATGAEMELVLVRPVWLTLERMNPARRFLHVAPWFRSKNGSSASVRVSACRVLPSSGSFINVDRGAALSSFTWTTSSTTWATGAEKWLQLASIKPSDGFVAVLVECNVNAETRGLAICQEGPRLVYTEPVVLP